MVNQEILWDLEYKKNKQKWRLQTKTLPKLLKGKRVLELGVGNGKTLKSILQQKPASVNAIDISQESIKQVSQDFHNSEVSLLKASVTNLPFQDKSFDVIVCYYVLNNLLQSEREKAVAEMLRVLNPKGIVLFEDFAEGDFRQKESKKALEKNTIEKENGLICHFFTLSELKGLFSKFSDVNLKENKSTPIAHKSQLLRHIIVGIATA